MEASSQVEEKCTMKMKTAQRRQKLIRAVYPNGSYKRGYHMVLTMHDAKRFAIPYWLTNWAVKLTPQTLGSY
jgi:hypothetical protein